jgi:acyl carrier protein
MSPNQTATEREVAGMIVVALNLDSVKPDDIDPAEPLFGAGLGLDSIDALELALEISKRYGFQIRSDDEDNRRIFASLAALSAHIDKNRAR